MTSPFFPDTPARARARYEAFHPTDANRMVTLTEAADACQAEVRRLRAEYLSLGETLRLANGRLNRAWEAVDRFNDEVSSHGSIPFHTSQSWPVNDEVSQPVEGE